MQLDMPVAHTGGGIPVYLAWICPPGTTVWSATVPSAWLIRGGSTGGTGTGVQADQSMSMAAASPVLQGYKGATWTWCLPDPLCEGPRSDPCFPVRPSWQGYVAMFRYSGTWLVTESPLSLTFTIKGSAYAGLLGPSDQWMRHLLLT